MSIVNTIKSNPNLKKLVHYMLIPKGQARPRTWVKWFERVGWLTKTGCEMALGVVGEYS
jgi:hypothetical protein